MNLRLFQPTPNQPPPGPPTVAAIVARFIHSQLARVALGTLSRQTAARQAETLQAFADAIGRQPVADCRNSDLIDWINSHAEWVSPHTKVTAMAHVVTCFRWGFDEGLIDSCPFSRRAKQWPRLEPRAAITPAEYARIMLLARDRHNISAPGKRYKRARCYKRTLLAFRFAMLFLWTTGARVGEMKKLRWRDIDLDAGVATLTEHKTRQATGHRRYIVLTAPLGRMLRWFHRLTSPHPESFVFVNGRGRNWKSSFAKTFRRYAGLAGVRREVTAYSLRHGFVVKALESGEGQRQIADVIGHTTTRYIEWYGRSARQNILYLKSVLNRINGHVEEPSK